MHQPQTSAVFVLQNVEASLAMKASGGFAVLETEACLRAPRRQRRIHSLLDLTKVGAHRQHRDVLAELSRWFGAFSLGLGWLDQPLYAFLKSWFVR